MSKNETIPHVYTVFSILPSLCHAPFRLTILLSQQKEARRVRNRESAAASRRKTRDRIAELELQVSALEAKYSAALRRIDELETGSAVQTERLPSLKLSVVSPPASVMASSPPLSPREDSLSLHGDDEIDRQREQQGLQEIEQQQELVVPEQEKNTKNQQETQEEELLYLPHIISISRPTAA